MLLTIDCDLRYDETKKVVSLWLGELFIVQCVLDRLIGWVLRVRIFLERMVVAVVGINKSFVVVFGGSFFFFNAELHETTRK